MGRHFGRQKNDAEKLALLKESDVLVDGPFLLAERSFDLNLGGAATSG